ncbi:non-ribosomal peptide synthetase [Corallococcus sp. Z5C101001]|uniref:non-ribosomal peptide synthetase n=1 Tax=Corallococcus sp. Z5C101001 TaxID=2596829 RepID=UPI00117E6E10|nr:non-ribosomal peptide synthetase [Corallococcus sp. Z5C101001]TSC34374.1 amino acid adenylation domain-containing protein [Corallococcus sp. Z5C101001]
MQDPALEGFRLSPQQERLWGLQRDGTAYRTQCAAVIDGELHRDTLLAALQHLVDRHEILRTSFRSLAGGDVVLQVISPSATPCLQEQDLGALAPARQEAQVERCYQEEWGRPFELEQGVKLRATLLRLAAGRHVLVLGAPAVCLDAGSMERLLEELARVYAALRRGPAPAQDEVVQYADFAQWQNDLEETDAGREGKAYWDAQVGRAEAVPRLAFELDSKAHPLAVRALTLDGETLAGLEALSRREDIPTSSVVLACWQVVLWRMAGQPDPLVIEVRSDGRKYEHLHSALGAFCQYAPLRMGLDAGAALADVARQAGAALREAHRWQEFLPATLRAKQDEGLGARRIGFSHQDWPAAWRAEGVTFEVGRLDSRSERLKLELVCVRRGDGPRLELRHDPTVYSARSIDQLQDALEALVGAVARESRDPVGALPIQGAKARQLMLEQWKAPASGGPPSRCIHALFEAQVERTPEAPAVTYEQVQLTYRQLNARANQLARHLRGLGVGPDAVVGVRVERSERMIVALLGILKAGGAWLPIEPSLPEARLGHLLQEAAARVLVTERDLAGAAGAKAAVVCLDSDEEVLSRQGVENVGGGAGASNLAYVIFTSGSTGLPKGVAVEHRQLAGYVQSAIERLALAELTRFATVSTFGADLGHTAIFPALCTGGHLHVISQERASDADALADYFARHPCELLKIVPSHLAALVASTAQPERIMPRERLVLGGEALTWGTLRVFQSHAPGCRIFNHYGPTETTVGVVAGETQAHAQPGLAATVPLGTPLAQAGLYLLDPGGQPVPGGVPGEVYIGGATVARGYIHRPGLTAERFVPDPFSGTPGARLYRTGDRARALPDGAIEFLGRVDRQVKLRGFRVELGEVEAVLRGHATVKQSVVVVGGEAGYQRLDAYVVGDALRPPSEDELHEYVKARLPDYMVPAHIIVLDRIPLTPNGKIDSRALPAPEHLLTEAGTASLAPRTGTEELLAGIFMELLGLDRVGIHDDFFDIGGHSLLATRLLARMRDVFQADLSLRDVFESPTVAGLAGIVESLLRGEPEPTFEPIPVAPREGGLPLSFAQERMWHQDRVAPNSPNTTVDVLLWLTGPLDAGVLSRALEEIVRRHEALRTTFTRRGEQPVQEISGAGPVCVTAEDLGAPAGAWEEAGRRVAQLAQGAFDVREGPLFRARLFRVRPEEHGVLLSMHHLVSDGFTRGVLIRELAALYDAFSAGRPSPLEPLAIQYADFAVWQRGLLRGASWERHRDYWTKQLAGAPARLALPTASTSRSGGPRRMAVHPFTVPEEAAARLRELGRRQGVTLYMVLLAAWQTLLSRLTGQEDVVVASPMAGRSRSETQALAGLFVHTQLMRTDLSGDPPFQELLVRVREGVLGAGAHQDLPLATLAGDLEPGAAPGSWPSAQVLLVVENALREQPRFGPLVLERVQRLGEDRSEAASHELALRVGVTTGVLEAGLEYNTALFEPAAMEELARRWLRLLERIGEDVQQRLSALAS